MFQQQAISQVVWAQVWAIILVKEVRESAILVAIVQASSGVV